MPNVRLLDGVPVVDLPDSKGKVFPYKVEALPPDRGVRRYRLSRLDGEGHSYEVRLVASDSWCSCPSFRWAFKRKKTTCKHIDACRELLAFMKAASALIAS